jgi:mannose-1-phosphate guanylyltransferase/mannose-6-phosphate isomerase
LWPLSTPSLPKQFVHLLPGGTLFNQTLERLSGIEGVAPPVIVTGADYADRASAAAKDMGMPAEFTIVEPAGRNTAPAALAAAFSVAADEILVILPADHIIEDIIDFGATVELAVDQAESGSIVTFGITPSGPETGFGYIEMGRESGHGYVVNRFKEKPGPTEAMELVADGRHVWNSGMFVVSAGLLIDEALTHCPKLAEEVLASLQPAQGATVHLDEGFRSVESISLDHAIMEKTEKAVVMPIDVGWSDVGSYQTLWELSEKDDAGNSVTGDVQIRDVSGSLIRASSRTVAVAGLSDVVVIETADAVLVVPRDRSQDVKDLAADAGGDRSATPSS